MCAPRITLTASEFPYFIPLLIPARSQFLGAKMATFPQLYKTSISSVAGADELAVIASPAPDLAVGAPAHFGGSDEHWSPETLLTGAVASCFGLSFAAVARARKFEWRDLDVDVEGTLDRVERNMQFTRFTIHARLTVASDDAVKAGAELLEKAEQSCLVSASLKSEMILHGEVVVAG
jgi:organic hydroperoxide reductase OsmC/OhrA